MTVKSTGEGHAVTILGTAAGGTGGNVSGSGSAAVAGTGGTVPITGRGPLPAIALKGASRTLPAARGAQCTAGVATTATGEVPTPRLLPAYLGSVAFACRRLPRAEMAARSLLPS